MRIKLLLIFSCLFSLSSNSFGQWIPQNSTISNGLGVIYFINDSIGFAGGAAGTLLRTIDGGDNWISYNTDLPDDFGISSIHFASDSIGYAAAGFGLGSSDDDYSKQKILRTTDGGNSWQIIFEDSALYFPDIFFVNDSTGYAVGGFYPRILKTSDSGQSWIYQRSSTVVDTILNSITFTDKNTGYAVGGILDLTSLILKTTDGGNTWSVVHSEFDRTLFSVEFPEDSIGYAVGIWGKIMKTIDAGNSWLTMNPPTNLILTSVYFVDADTGYAVGDSGLILKTVDGGQNWFQQNSGTSEVLISVYFTGASTGYICGTGGLILKTINGGGTYSYISGYRYNDLVVLVYPNPNKGNFSIRIINNKKQKVAITIVDILGREVFHKDLMLPKDNFVFTINSLNSAKGLHILKLRTNTGTVNKKVMIH